ncbi:MAG: hypothetical protein SPL00_02355 [Bacilli bacterium]|nr:hypothetical protein [Bacilli bacterium]
MQIFRKREKPIENLTLIALIIALQAIFSIFTAVFSDVVVIPLLILITVPISSVLISVNCSPRYYAVYLIASIGLNVAVSCYNLSNTIFYIIPSILVGFVYGVFLNFKIPTSLNIFFSSIVELLLWIASLYLIKAIYEIDFQNVVLSLIKKNNVYGTNIFLLIGFGVSLLQVALINVFIIVQSKYLSLSFIEEFKIQRFYWGFAAVFASLSFIFGLFYLPLAYLFLGFGIYWALYCLKELVFNRHSVIILFLLISICGGILIFAFTYSNLSKEKSFLLINIFPLFVSIFQFLNSILFKKKS